MNKEQLKGNWNELKGRVKNAWGELSDDDIKKIDGDYDRLVGAIQEKTGKTKEEAHKAIDSLFS